MRAAIYQNRASGFRKYLNLTIDPEDAQIAGANWGDHPAPAFVWFEKEHDKVVIVFDQALVPKDRVLVNKRIKETKSKIAYSKLINPINKSDPGRLIGFMLHGVGMDETLKTFERHPIDYTVNNGRIVIYVKHLRVLGEAREERQRLKQRLHSKPDDSKAAPDQAPAPVESVAETDAAKPPSLGEVMRVVQQFLDANPDLKVTTMGRKAAIIAA